jgi:hypothetical protein
MFERLRERAERRAQSHAAARRERLAERVAAGAPRGVEIGVEGERVVLSGRGLGRRLLIDPALRWLVAESRHDG